MPGHRLQFKWSSHQIQQKGKDRDVSSGRKVLTLAAKEYGYKGKEIAEFTKKDPAIVTRHLKEKKNLEGEIKKVIETLREKDECQ